MYRKKYIVISILMSRRNPLSRQDIEEYNRQLQQELDDFELQLIGEELDIAQEEIMDIDINDPMLTQIGQEFDVMSEELKLLEDQEEEVLFVPSERTRGQRRRRQERKIRERKENRLSSSGSSITKPFSQYEADNRGPLSDDWEQHLGGPNF